MNIDTAFTIFICCLRPVLDFASVADYQISLIRLPDATVEDQKNPFESPDIADVPQPVERRKLGPKDHVWLCFFRNLQSCLLVEPNVTIELTNKINDNSYDRVEALAKVRASRSRSGNRLTIANSVSKSSHQSPPKPTVHNLANRRTINRVVPIAYSTKDSSASASSAILMSNASRTVDLARELQKQRNDTSLCHISL